ncbi:S8 family serine peptidase [Flavobacterium sp.]|uniref:S8 family serine peptidase n=1 Tax=Flavobacterium sp. TaxID=239 RepID=UPI00286A5904|nr:S8 family serine peptidase [Flavobacterium sp.]
MKTLYTFLVLCCCSVVIAQNQAKSSAANLVVKLKEYYFNQQRLDLNRLKTGDVKLDQFLSNWDVVAIEPIGQPQITKTFLVVFKTEKDIPTLVQQCKSIASVAYAEPNYIAMGGGEQIETNAAETIPNDTHFGKQWGLLNNGTQTGIGTVTADADVDMELAWDIETGDPNMIIAVPDSGLKMNHPDIASRIWTNPNEIVNGIDDDNNGYIDDINGWDWVNADNNPTDDHGHGSNVAGIIGAIANNNSLFTGANWNSKIMPLKVLDATNSGTYAAMANAIFYAVDNGAKVISMSIGGSGSSTLLSDAMAYMNTHNVVFTVCMMNFNTNQTYYPAGYSLSYPNIIAVGSTNPNDQRTAPFFWSATSGSSYGTHINVVAPGNYIYGLSHTSNTSSSAYWGGTSQATPLVASIASLMLAHNPNLSPTQVREIIQNTAQDQVGNPTEDTAGFDQYMGYGRVNAYAALQQTLGLDAVGSAPVAYFKIINPIQLKQLEVISDGTFTGEFELIITTMDGKVVENKKINIQSGVTTVPFSFSAGNYIVTLKSQAYKKIFKVVNGE